MNGKYLDWTRGEEEALLNIVGGTEVARAVLRGDKKLTVENIAPQQSVTPPPLVGTVVKTITLKPYNAKSVAEAIKLGKYDGVDGDIVQLFADDEVGLTTAQKVILVQFDRNWTNTEVLAWAKENGDKKPILPKHIYAIGAQHPEEQRKRSIAGCGSVRDGSVLCLGGNSDWRRLRRGSVSVGWGQGCMVGFLSE